MRLHNAVKFQKKKKKTKPTPKNQQIPKNQENPKTINGDIKRKGKEDYVNMQISVSKC